MLFRSEGDGREAVGGLAGRVSLAVGGHVPLDVLDDHPRVLVVGVAVSAKVLADRVRVHPGDAAEVLAGTVKAAVDRPLQRVGEFGVPGDGDGQGVLVDVALVVDEGTTAGERFEVLAAGVLAGKRAAGSLTVSERTGRKRVSLTSTFFVVAGEFLLLPSSIRGRRLLWTLGFERVFFCFF